MENSYKATNVIIKMPNIIRILLIVFLEKYLQLSSILLEGNRILTGAVLDYAVMKREELWPIRNMKKGMDFWNEFRQENLDKTLDLAYIEVPGIKLEGINFSNTILEGADLGEAHLVKANLSTANLEGANLEGANLFGSKLHVVDLREANLNGCNLEGALMQEA